MSYLDVQVLRRFTKKLANALPGSATMGAETWATPQSFRTDLKEKGMYENYAKPALDAVSNAGDAAAAKVRHLTGNEMDVTPATMRGSVGDNAHITGAPTVGERLTGAHDQLKGSLGDYAKYLPDMQTLGYGAGGALLGGLGTMGLAQLLRSEEEKKKGPSLLAGLGGAAAGSVALPLLMQYLAGGNAAPGTGTDAATMGTKPITLKTNPGLNG